MNVSIVLGLGFGDEGKGRVVDWLCTTKSRPLVVRFNGGHQVGHTVSIKDGTSHIFSNFGSGTLREVNTYYGEECVVDPVGLMKEEKILKDKGIIPVNIYHPNCRIVIPQDKYANISDEKNNYHGSVGVGFGRCIQRNEDGYHIYMRDLGHINILIAKYQNIVKHYYSKYTISMEEYAEFLKGLYNLRKYALRDYSIFNSATFLKRHTNIIFEGGQGIMLDQEFGYFPNVTRSYTTARNALDILKHINRDYTIDTYYVTRPYNHRHGEGPMAFPDVPIKLVNTYTESNKYNQHQGDFRVAPLDLDQIEYAIKCDRSNNYTTNSILCITCVDQIDTDYIMAHIDLQLVSADISGFIHDVTDTNYITKVITFDSPANE